MLPIFTASKWIFLPVVSSRLNNIEREIKNPHFADPPLSLKAFRNCEICCPLYFEFVESLGAPRSTRTSVLQSVNILSDSIWLVDDDLHILVLVLNRWAMGWLCTHRCAQIVVHTWFLFVKWLAHTIHMQILYTCSENLLATIGPWRALIKWIDFKRP